MHKKVMFGKYVISQKIKNTFVLVTVGYRKTIFSRNNSIPLAVMSRHINLTHD